MCVWHVSVNGLLCKLKLKSLVADFHSGVYAVMLNENHKTLHMDYSLSQTAQSQLTFNHRGGAPSS